MDELPLDPRSLANYILTVRKHFGFETTNLELQKILYFSYGKYLVSYGEKLCDGYFEAWEHGPVHPLVYREFKRFGPSPITSRAESTNLVTGEIRVVAPPSDTRRRTHIAETVLQLRNLNAGQLREKSHARGGPWDLVWTRARVNLASQVIIPDMVIRGAFNRHILLADVTGQTEEPLVEDIPPELDRGR